MSPRGNMTKYETRTSDIATHFSLSITEDDLEFVRDYAFRHKTSIAATFRKLIADLRKKEARANGR